MTSEVTKNASKYVNVLPNKMNLSNASINDWDLMKNKMYVYDIIMAYIILYSILYALNMNMSRKANVT